MATITEKNKPLVRRWLEGYERGVLDFGMLDPNFVDHTAPVGLLSGIEVFRLN